MKPTGREPDPAFDRLVARGLARELDASGNACPDADLLAAWFDHTLSALESERIEVHAAGCECCQQILASLARSEPPVIRAAPLPEPARAWHWHWRWALPLATAVLVLVVGSHTLRAPGPRLRPSGFGEAGQQPIQVEAGQQPAQVAMNQAAPTPGADRRSRTAMASQGVPPPPPRGLRAANSGEAGSRLRPSGFGEAGSQLAKAEPAPVVAPTAGAVLEAMRPESRMAEQAQRQAGAASDKMLKASAPSPAAPPPPPRLAETVAVAGGAPRQGFDSLSVRQASVTTSMLSGSTVSWRFGTSGAIEKSSDRGQTWVRQSSGVTTALSDASAPGDRICWIVGAAGVVLRTTDGVTWQRVTSPSDANLVAVHAWNELAATVTASDRSEYETTDGGKTWKRR